MSTQPSEHAMRAAKEQYRVVAAIFNPGPDDDFYTKEAAIIDQYAIVPAVAERDKRIEELERAVQLREDEHLIIVSKLHDADKRIAELEASGTQ